MALSAIAFYIQLEFGDTTQWSLIVFEVLSRWWTLHGLVMSLYPSVGIIA